MITVLPTNKSKFRTFGWVQNPSNLRSLCDVVAIFDSSSEKHKALVSETIPKLISEADGQCELINALNARPLKIKYSHLVGSSFSPRSAARCNGIVQASVKGQGKKEFIDDWSADGFVRWSHCFGFVKYDFDSDSFDLTESGKALVAANTAIGHVGVFFFSFFW